MLYITCALSCEAKPLIGDLRLQNQNIEGPFPIYAKDDIRLIISGIGRLHAAAACTYLAARCPESQTPAWLNIGIGGARSLAIGETYWAHRIIDSISGQTYYPGLSLGLPLTSSTIHTSEQAVSDYPDEQVIYDMEAAGFYAMASAFTPSELVHCIKIISDNAEQDHQQISKALVESLITQQLPGIKQSIEQLTALQQDYAEERDSPAIYFELLDKFRFSQTQKSQLKRLLFRWQALGNETDLTVIPHQKFRSSKELIGYLEAQLSNQAFHLHHPDN